MRKDIIKSIILTSLLMVGGTKAIPANAAVAGNNYSACFSAGEKAYAASNFTVAAENFAQALKYRPDDLRTHFKYAQALFSLNKYDESSSHFQTVIQNSPNNIIARVYLAENMLQLGKPQVARQHVDWVLRVQPQHKRANELLDIINGKKPMPVFAPAKVAAPAQVPASPMVEAKPVQTASANVEKNVAPVKVASKAVEAQKPAASAPKAVEAQKPAAPAPKAVEAQKPAAPAPKAVDAKKPVTTTTKVVENQKPAASTPKMVEAQKSAPKKVVSEKPVQAVVAPDVPQKNIANNELDKNIASAPAANKSAAVEQVVERELGNLETQKESQALEKTDKSAPEPVVKNSVNSKSEQKKRIEPVAENEIDNDSDFQVAPPIEPETVVENVPESKPVEKSVEKVAEKEDTRPSEEPATLKQAPKALPSQKLSVPTMPKSIQDDRSEAVIDSAESEDMVFMPYVAGQQKKAPQVAYSKPVMPKAVANVQSTDMKSFFAAGKGSFIVNLEKARYEIESGNVESALKTIELADKLARAGDNNRNLIEVQIFKSLALVYNCEFTKFGKHLMTLKSVMSPESYQSFLDIYSQAAELKSDDDRRRLAAGVAVGAGHYAVVAKLLRPVFEKNPDDALLGAMLSEAQLQTFDYKGAGKTLNQIAASDSNNPEAFFNLARFYLTADFQPDLVRSYAEYASSLRPDDSRIGVLLALADYSEGKINEGIQRIKELLPTVEDKGIQAICQHLIADGESNNAGNKKNFIAMLALPGSKHASPKSMKYVGEDALKLGSYFSAIARFEEAGEKAEVGRAYLGIASALTNAGEKGMAATAAGYGLKLLNDEIACGRNVARASLYMALYHYECGDKEAAIASVNAGLDDKKLDRATYNKLVTLYDSLAS